MSLQELLALSAEDFTAQVNRNMLDRHALHRGEKLPRTEAEVQAEYELLIDAEAQRVLFS